MFRIPRLFQPGSVFFTLQWHLTNRCHFRCRHCYDRSSRQEIPFHEALRVLTDFQSFCRQMGRTPHISLSGGDPFLYPDFWQLYGVIAERGIPVSFLGNPISAEWIERVKNIYPPQSYQVSLEGLRTYNDTIRGAGHFDRTIDFLLQARRLGLTTRVMLTLHRDNMDQVLPLGELLRGLTAGFTFNRLSPVGEGKDMELPSKAEYIEFLQTYLAARRRNPVLGVKDNLLNVIRKERKLPLFPGCTGKGCGAAKNFVALLPDGEVHACRKFPSPIGHIRESSFHGIYHSVSAKQYRYGAQECWHCILRENCGGCLAVSYGCGLPPLKQRDPFCFLGETGQYSLETRRI